MALVCKVYYETTVQVITNSVLRCASLTAHNKMATAKKKVTSNEVD